MESQKKNLNLLTVVLLVLFFPIGLSLMWARTNWNKKIKYAITGFFSLLVLISVFSNNNTSTNTNTKIASASQSLKPTNTPAATPTPTITPTPVPRDANGFPMDAERVTVTNLDKAPSQYEGKKITFTCEIAGFAKDSNGNATAVNCSDPNDFTSLIQVDISAFDVTKINQDDIVRFYGLGMGSYTGNNAYGGQVTETGVQGIYINDATSGYKE